LVRGPAWPEGHDGRALRNRTTERWAVAETDEAERARLVHAVTRTAATLSSRIGGLR
jgi:hypothetical protein